MIQDLRLTTPGIEVCDFTDPSHCRRLCDMVNSYITDPMGGGTPLSDRQKLHLLDGLENHPSSIVLFAIDEGNIAGYVIAYVNFSTFAAKPMINVHDLFVEHGYRRHGYGKKLLDQLTGIAIQKGCAKLTLEVRKDNHEAMTLYKSLGYEEGATPMNFWIKTL